MTTSTLLLLHGLGATSGVWTELIAELDWPGKIINAELAGHGRAPAQVDYTIGALAAAAGGQCEIGEEVIAVGHSLGGGVALCLASGFFRPVVTGVVAVGIKANWSDADVTGMAKVAAKGVRWFDSRAEAADRFLLQAGLTGLVNHDHPAVATGITEVDRRWRVAQDPQTFAQRPLDLTGLVAAAMCPVILGAGENDAMVSGDELRTFVANPRVAPGRGHNVQVEDPGWFADLIREIATT